MTVLPEIVHRNDYFQLSHMRIFNAETGRFSAMEISHGGNLYAH